MLVAGATVAWMATRVVPIPYRLCPYEPAANLGTTAASLGLGVNRAGVAGALRPGSRALR